MSKSILNLFDENEIENISKLIEKLENSSFDYLRLVDGDINIVIGKNGVMETTATSTVKAEEPAKASQTPEEKPLISAEVIKAESAAAPVAEVAQAKSVEEKEGIHIFRATTWGLFYAQSEPGAPPYVKIGDKVTKGDTLGILEIMKTFNAITCDVDGEICEIHVVNEQMLEPEMPMFSIKL